VLAAGIEVLKSDGYAGLTTAKVAARSGQNKALIGYHFGSKNGLVAAAAMEVAQAINDELVGGLASTRTVDDLVRGVLDGLWRMIERDERLARLYFDLAAASVVEPEVRAVMRDMRDGWRTTLTGLLAAADDGPPRRAAEAASVYVIAGLDGLALERLARGDTPALRRARELFVASAVAAIRGPR
jgi:AcrR family transcriptional regulator